ncbi:arginine deiminase family protein [soil metagenome]
MDTATAIVRGVPDTFDAALVMGERPKLEVAKARKQHANYCTHLAKAGYELAELPADDDYPDCLFVEDTAVVIGRVAVICRSGASARRGEVGPVADRLATTFELRPIVEPGTIDGGDVFIAGDTIFVGLSLRTNQEAVRQLTEVGRELERRVVPIEVQGVLHLKSAVLPIDDHTVVVTPGTVDETLLSDFEIIPEAAEERHRFSALPLADGTVLVTANAPKTANLVAARGFSVVPVNVSEIQAADGGLTCMSILY